MRKGNSFSVLTAAMLSLVFVESAAAMDWVDTGHAILIDVDSIRQGADGLIYHLEKPKPSYFDEDPTPLEAASDCVNRIAYSGYSLKYEANWRTRGQPVLPGTMGAVLLDFVCDRVK